MTVLDHIESIYSETKFEYLPFLKVLSNFTDKEDARRQLNELLKQGIVKKNKGLFGGILIEYCGNLRTVFENDKNTTLQN